jgi:hypothetical protein
MNDSLSTVAGTLPCTGNHLFDIGVGTHGEHQAFMRLVVRLVGVEIDWRNGQDKVADLVGIKRRVGGRHGATLADTKQGDLVDTLLFADEIHGIVKVTIEVVVHVPVLVHLARITPVVEEDVDPLVQQVTDQRTVRLQVGHLVTIDQRRYDEQRRLHDLRRLDQRMVVVDLDPVLFENHILRRAANVDIVVGQVGEIVDALGKLRVERCGFGRDVGGKNLDWKRKHG